METSVKVLLSSSIFTGLGMAPFDGAVVLSGRHICCVGPRELAQSCPSAEIHDFGTRTILPAFHDAHLHLLVGALSEKGGFLRDDESEAAAARHLFTLNASGGDEHWLLGGAWDHFKWPGQALPTKESLDRYFPNRCVFLLNKECHGAWVNSRTLAYFNIHRDTPDPMFGEIFRDEAGNPTGYLHESAAHMILSKILAEIPNEQLAAYVEGFTKKAWSYGITSVSDMQIFGMCMQDVYDAMDTKDSLGIRVHYTAPLTWDSAKLLSMKKRHRGARLRFSGTKDFVDGTPMGHTGLMIAPYRDKPESVGSPAIDLDFLKEKVCELDALGIRTRLHCCGDMAVRIALDDFEYAMKENATSGLRHSIEHIEAISPEDIPRFGMLGVVASVQPDHLPKYDFENHPFQHRLGAERMRWSWPFHSLLAAGGRLAFGTDYSVAELNPMRGLYRAVTRLTDDKQPHGGFSPMERLTLADALSAYTAGSAYVNEREKELGTLEAGKLADIAVLDCDIFRVPAEELKRVHVTKTFMDGEVVFEV